ncbi:MAG TPA: glycosyltransferase family 4 protein, partial [Phycisphaerae bacterium]|nr:glycosyltransferase family 4 protein [Phycisphaerae bacterium]
MLDLAMGLRALGVAVTIACPRPGALAARADAAGVPVLAIPKIRNIDRNAIHRLADLLKKGEVDLIHAHNGRTHIAAAYAVRKAGCGRCIATQHFLAPARTTRTGLKRLVANYLHRRASAHTAHTIAISDAVRNAALARRDDAPAKMTTVHNGSAPPDLTGAADAWTVRRSLGLAAEAPFVFCAARLQEEKDIPTLIAAMRDVAARHPDARCCIAGEGDEMPALQKQVKEDGVDGRVQLLGFRNDIPALMRACDLFVLPALAEPFGLVLLEAMALGKPVIATRAGGPPEIVEHEKTGLLVAPQNPAEMAAAISGLIADPARRAALGAAGAERYRAHFTVERMAREVLAIYNRALGVSAGQSTPNSPMASPQAAGV